MADHGVDLRALALGEVSLEHYAAAMEQHCPDPENPYTTERASADLLALRWACVLAERYPGLSRFASRGGGDGDALAPLIVDGDLPAGWQEAVRAHIDDVMSVAGIYTGTYHVDGKPWDHRLLEVAQALVDPETFAVAVEEQPDEDGIIAPRLVQGDRLRLRRLWGRLNGAVRAHRAGVDGWKKKKQRALQALWNELSPPRPGGSVPEPAGVRQAYHELNSDLLPRIYLEAHGDTGLGAVERAKLAGAVEAKYRSVLPLWIPARLPASARAELERRYGGPASVGDIVATVVDLDLFDDENGGVHGDLDGLDLLARDLLVIATGVSPKTVRNWTE